ncbi:jg8992 [Pararge aegeria aegeria]|uniref:Jg8992 protein n=1 Tax=Pararge aegeria aegeria TaxID=348720 RepID=A0A8S4SNF1_9NEOP|nr:jg8992 [Pararge aegeria aegeria]
MDTSKYSAPKLPTIKNMLEDISDPSAVQGEEKLKISNNEGLLFDAYNCYLNIKRLKEDLITQDSLNTKLEDLNTELLQNIENMKKQR